MCYLLCLTVDVFIKYNTTVDIVKLEPKNLRFSTVQITKLVPLAPN